MSDRFRPRGFILVAVLIITSVSLMVATTLLYLSQAELMGRAVIQDSAHSRSLAASGLHVLLRRLNAQRNVILEGRLPHLDDQYIIFEGERELGVIRLLPIGPERLTLVPESSRLDVNHADEDMLIATGLLTEDEARAIIRYRDSRPGGRLHSISELLEVPGITAEMLYGPLEEMSLSSEVAGAELDLGERIMQRIGAVDYEALNDVLTVFSFEPPLQRNGRLRINLNVPWSEELGDRIEARFGRDARQGVRAMMEDGVTFETERRIFELLNFFGVPPEEWPDIIDTFTTSDDDFLFGRIDLNSAPEEVIATLPGVEYEQAVEVVRRREQIDSESRSTVAWPAIEGIFDPEVYIEIGDRVTVRSWTYRIRFAAGLVDAGDPDGPLIRPVLFEIVIDLAGPAPRIAQLRDVSLLETAAVLALEYDYDLAGQRRRGGLDGAGVPVGLDAIAGYAPDGFAAADGIVPLDDPLSGSSSRAGAPDWPAPGRVADEREEDFVADPQESADSMESGPAGRGRIGRWRIGN